MTWGSSIRWSVKLAPALASTLLHPTQADFCNPGLLGWWIRCFYNVTRLIRLFLGTYNNFKKIYEAPILKSRAPGCSAKEQEMGEARLQQLLESAKSFVLRRDATILKNYLPPKRT